MDDQAAYSPCTVEEVLRDYRARRAAMVKALTTEVEDFFAECDPAKDNLCLYGFPDESWKVSIPAEEVPPELPEPALGINFARDGMERKDWLSLVAVHSDSWLFSVAFYYAARFDSADRKRLFEGINESATLFEIVTGRAKDKPTARSKKQQQQQHQHHHKEAPKRTPKKEEEEDEYEEDDEDEHGDTYCGLCGEPYNNNQFWIACDICQKWYHGSCVKMTAAKAANIEEYKCPPCSNNNKRSRGA